MHFGTRTTEHAADEQRALEARNMLATLSPLIQTMYTTLPMHYLRKSMNILLEYFLYLLGLAFMAFPAIMDRTFPFHVLGDILDKKAYLQATTGKGDMELFSLAVKGQSVTIGLLLIVIGILVRKASRRKSLLHASGRELRKVEAYFLAIVSKQNPDLQENTGTTA
ncbi:MAG: hypothetical protein RIQ62_1060 [Bacteroidota bacterium]|jgi:hypothetical protein